MFTSFLGALSAIAPLSIDMGLPGIPAIEATFGDAGNRGSMTLSLFLVGFSAAPLFIGPLSDRFGRRMSLIAGLSFFSGAALCSAFAPTFTTLLIARFVQGAAGGAIATLPVVMVRDVLEGPSARAKLSQIVAILGIAPSAAPLIGAAILAIGSWRSIYLAQALVGVLELSVAATWLAETHPRERRRSLDIRVLLDGYGTILSDAGFTRYGLVYTFSFTCMFSYISTSPAVFMSTFALSDRGFSVLFSITSAGIMAGAMLSARLSRRFHKPEAVVTAGLGCMVASTIALVAIAALGLSSAYGIAALATVVMLAFGTIAGPCNHAALSELGHVAGSAARLMRRFQMLSAGIASALGATLAANIDHVYVMVGLMLGAAMLAGLFFVVPVRPRRRQERMRS
ncbi:MAG TPA: Bcr/CflA family efflux MFS transporter [Paraburkholderia sp.]|nr:Bcr/CflA family efflux MFS transporter [Paraburkholderia sp.]